MALHFKPAAPIPASRAVRSTRTIRKVGLLGSHTGSLKWCPWMDPSWELWGHASSRQWYRRELDRYFDLHRKECWTRNGKKDALYVEWLKGNTVPIYMQERHAEVPASKRYPKEQILMEYGGARQYFKNHLAWMIALAFSEGVTHLGLFGINYGADTEYQTQRGSAEYWLGRAEERGIHLVIPDGCTLLAEPAGLYGYESHDGQGMLREQYKARHPKPAETITPLVAGEKREQAKPPTWLVPDIAAEEIHRPVWARMTMDRTDGETHA